MTKKINSTNFPHVKVASKFALFQEYCLGKEYLITHSVPLIYNDNGTLDKVSKIGIKSIIYNKYGDSAYSKKETDLFIEYIRIQSLAKIGWPFNQTEMFRINDGLDHKFASPFNESKMA